MDIPSNEGKQPPAAIAAQLSGYRPHRDGLGRSSAHVFRLESEARPALYLKVEQAGPFADLGDEAARLAWLRAQGLACPEVIAFESDGARNWLLTTALPGHDLASTAVWSPLSRARLLAEALRALHALDIDGCPFDHRLENRIAIAASRLAAGLVDEADFDALRLGRSGRDLLVELQARRPASEDPMVAHGDACLPNFIVCEDGFSGYIDCCRLGIADRYQDLALACWSIAYNLGDEMVRPFLDAYGLADVDPERLDYYRLLDEFF